MKKDEFKEFVRKNPKLANYVKKDEMTWQKFYEMYELYGEDSNVWDEYLKEKTEESKSVKAGVSGFAFGEFINWLKNVDLDGLQEGIGNVQRVLGVVQDLSKKDNTSEKQTYKPRPLYKHFED